MMLKVAPNYRAITNKYIMHYNYLDLIVPPAINIVTQERDILDCLKYMLHILCVATMNCLLLLSNNITSWIISFRHST